MAGPNYAIKTYQNENPLVRYAHQRRYTAALRLLPDEEGTLLDFGAGDGYFERVLKKSGIAKVFSYDLEHRPGFLRWEDLQKHQFDTITCLEVLEHCSDDDLDDVIASIVNLVRSEGRLIISVPVEVGPVSLIKNLTRWLRGYGGGRDFTCLNLLRGALGMKVNTDRSKGRQDHLGFNHFNLIRKLRNNQRLELEQVATAPFPLGGWLVNSQMLYKFRRVS